MPDKHEGWFETAGASTYKTHHGITAPREQLSFLELKFHAVRRLYSQSPGINPLANGIESRAQEQLTPVSTP